MSSSVSESNVPASPAVWQRRSRLRFLNRTAWLLVLAGAALYFYFCEGWRDVTVGREHRKANDLFTQVEGITEVRIYLLAGGPAKQRGGKPGSVTLTGDALDEFLGIWQFQSPSANMSAFCHSPAYHFQLYRGSRMVAETSICWLCSNFTLEVWPGREPVLYGFHAKGGAAQGLLKFCDSRLPYWREPPADADAPKANGGRTEKK